MKLVKIKAWWVRYWRANWVAWLCGVFGVVYFLAMFGMEVVDVTNTAWLMNRNMDLTQHQVGWEYFRVSSWNFPHIGMIDGLAYPDGLSVMFVDSIPIVAILFKIFSEWLPESFQYFGLFGLMCYFLMAFVAAKIFGLFTKNMWVVIFGSALLVMSPVMFARVFVHTALAAHFVVLLAVYLLLTYRRRMEWRKFVLSWGALMVLAVGVHLYFVPMVGALMMSALVLSWVNWRGSILKIGVSVAAMGVWMWLIGAFTIPMRNAVAGGLGEMGINLLAMFNGGGYSRMLRPIAMPEDGMNSGLAYLGMGVIGVLVILLGVGILELARKRKKTSGWRKWVTWQRVLAMVPIVGLVVLAMGPVVAFGQHELVRVELPGLVERIWSIFRATERLFWPIYYLVVIGVVIGVIIWMRKVKVWATVVVLGLAVLVQVQDVVRSDMVLGWRSEVMAMASEREYVLSDGTRGVVEGFCEGRRHLVILDDINLQEVDAESFDVFDVGVVCGLTLSDGYFARKDWRAIELRREEIVGELMRGEVREEYLYMTVDERLVEAIFESSGLELVQVGRWWVW
ncbi:DUF6311 domain-containing protein [Candidatus Saccharibacteria bacterium]|nr:DUF6311 domain-containing protein [Candidatus Saccharibacteria bacterium]